MKKVPVSLTVVEEALFRSLVGACLRELEQEPTKNDERPELLRPAAGRAVRGDDARREHYAVYTT